MSIFKNKIFIGITKVCIMVSLSSCSYEGYSSSDSYFKRSGYSYYPAYIDTEANNTFRSANNFRNISNTSGSTLLTRNNTRVINNNAPRVIQGEYTGNDLARDLGIPKPAGWDDPNVVEIWDPGTKQFHNFDLSYTGKDLRRDLETGVVKRQYTGSDLANDIGIKSISNVSTDATPQDLIQTVSDSANNDTASVDNSSANNAGADADTASADNSGSDNAGADADTASADNSGSDNAGADNASADNSGSDNSSADTASADKANESEAKAE